MTAKKQKSVLNRAARHLGEWARTLRDSEMIRFKEHPRFRQFDDTPQGISAQHEYESMQECATELRRMARGVK